MNFWRFWRRYRQPMLTLEREPESVAAAQATRKEIQRLNDDITVLNEQLTEAELQLRAHGFPVRLAPKKGRG